MPTSEIDWQEEQLIVSLGGQQQTLDDIRKKAAVRKKRLLGFGHEKNGMVTMKFADGEFIQVPKTEFTEIEKQWNLLQNYQLDKLNKELQQKQR